MKHWRQWPDGLICIRNSVSREGLSMPKIYRYVGPRRIAERSLHAPMGMQINSSDGVLRWSRQTGQALTPSGGVTATFIIDEHGNLRIADRRSEHVACAGG